MHLTKTGLVFRVVKPCKFYVIRIGTAPQILRFYMQSQSLILIILKGVNWNPIIGYNLYKFKNFGNIALISVMKNVFL